MRPKAVPMGTSLDWLVEIVFVTAAILAETFAIN